MAQGIAETGGGVRIIAEIDRAGTGDARAHRERGSANAGANVGTGLKRGGNGDGISTGRLIHGAEHATGHEEGESARER